MTRRRGHTAERRPSRGDGNKLKIDNMVTSAALAHLISAAPSWCQIKSAQGNEARALVQAIQQSGKPTSVYEIMIVAASNDVVRAREATPAHLPIQCPTRHIEAEGWWCIGMRSGHDIRDVDDATRWWRKLEGWILFQETAARTGFWPQEAEISHGEAGETQMLAEAVARERDLSGDYAMVLRDEGHLFRGLRLIRKLDANVRPLVNGRAACICNSRYRNGRLKLRRQCWAENDNCLIRMEALRRKQQADFIEDLKASGFKCCGTMEVCPFR